MDAGFLPQLEVDVYVNSGFFLPSSSFLLSKQGLGRAIGDGQTLLHFFCQLLSSTLKSDSPRKVQCFLLLDYTGAFAK